MSFVISVFEGLDTVLAFIPTLWALVLAFFCFMYFKLIVYFFKTGELHPEVTSLLMVNALDVKTCLAEHGTHLVD